MRKLSKKQLFWIVAASLFLIFIAYVIWGNISLKTIEYTVTSDRLPESFSGFRIAQISDLHNVEFGKNNQRLLKKLAQAEPDIIVITGDLIDSGDTNVQIASDFCKEAVKIAPVYYISGNHDVWAEEFPLLCDELLKTGVCILKDASEKIYIDNDSIQLIGIQDPEWYQNDPEKSQPNYDTNEIDVLVADLMQEDQYTILLSHRPEFFSEYIQSGVDLVFTGHAHGGQIRIPFIGGIYAPYQGFFPEYDSGIYTKDSTAMVVSRGLGNGTIIPRVNNRPEIVIVELKSTKK